jgi:hypothetical protein
LLDSYPLYLADDTDNDIVYIFESDLHGEYNIKFSKASHWFSDRCDVCHLIYEASFTPIKDKQRSVGHDPRIPLTIFKALAYFMDEYNCPIMYSCDSNDARQLCRANLFTRWFSKVDSEQYQHRSVEFSKFDEIINLGIVGFVNDPHFEYYFNELFDWSTFDAN